MSRIAGSAGAVRYRDYRRRFIPVVTTGLAILLGLFPLVVSSVIMPDLGFLVLITWRLLRPEIWMPSAALGFGLFDDLVSGHPLGQSMALWTIIFLLFDLLETRINYKDFWTDWLFAAGAIILHTIGAWYIALLMHSHNAFNLLLPPIVIAVLIYPLVARLVLGFDRWRLSR
jgi:rod shape-determining protein MreD